MGIDTFLLIAALIFFLLDAFRAVLNLNITINLTALGLALWVLSLLV